MAEWDLTERVVIALNGAQDVCRSILTHLEQSDVTLTSLSEETERAIRELADECDYLAAQPLARMIGYRGKR